MSPLAPVRYRPGVIAALLAAATVGALFLWQGWRGFSLFDEGYLWYGVQRVLAGEVPLRDFMAYDPGRYYWSAALLAPGGDDGIIAVRATVAFFQALGLSVGLWLVARVRPQPSLLLLIVASVILAVWMFPRHKLFDISWSILLVGALAHLIERPEGRRYVLAGVAVGLAAVFGRNHGLYGIVGSAGVLLLLAIRRRQGPGLLPAIALWAAGVVLGFLPVLGMLGVVPGYATAFGESLRFLFEFGATNIGLPVPYPWRVPFAELSPFAAARAMLIGVFFLAVVAFGIIGAGVAVIRRLTGRPLAAAPTAAAFLSLPDAHYAYSRADVPHLAQGVFPLLIGLLTLLPARPAFVRGPAAVLLAAMSLVVMLPLQPGWQSRTDPSFKKAEISGSTLVIDATTAGDVALLKQLTDRYAPEGRNLVVTPLWPGAYPLLGRWSPMWEIYALFPRDTGFENAEIERIRAADPGLVVVIDYPLDGRDDLRFANTHPLTNHFITETYERVTEAGASLPIEVYRAREARR